MLKPQPTRRQLIRAIPLSVLVASGSKAFAVSSSMDYARYSEPRTNYYIKTMNLDKFIYNGTAVTAVENREDRLDGLPNTHWLAQNRNIIMKYGVGNQGDYIDVDRNNNIIDKIEGVYTAKVFLAIYNELTYGMDRSKITDIHKKVVRFIQMSRRYAHFINIKNAEGMGKGFRTVADHALKPIPYDYGYDAIRTDVEWDGTENNMLTAHHRTYAPDNNGVLIDHRKTVPNPLFLLESAELGCGHDGYLAAYLMRAGGHTAYYAGIANHQLGIVYYDGKAHYLDISGFGNGELIVDENGKIPSIFEIRKSKSLRDKLDALSFWNTPDFENRPLGYSSLDARNGGVYHGWATYPSFSYFIDPMPGVADYTYSEGVGPYYVPKAPYISGITMIGDNKVKLEWKTSYWEKKNAQGEYCGKLLMGGYRVYVSTKSRGWNYDGNSMPDNLLQYKSGGKWDQHKYIARYTPLDSQEVTNVPYRDGETTCSVVITLRKDRDSFITIMPFDKHGESCGKKIYPMSEEIVIKVT